MAHAANLQPGTFAADLSVDPLAFQWHPEVWLLVAFLVGAYVYAVRVIGPKAVPVGAPVVSRMNMVAFPLAMLVLWIASDWPMHDISEEYLYSDPAHDAQLLPATARVDGHAGVVGPPAPR